MATRTIQVQPKTLQGDINSTDTQFIIEDFVGLDGNVILQADIGGTNDVLYGTFEPNTIREEAFSAKIIANSGTTVTFQCTRGLIGKHPYSTGGIAYNHDAGSKVVFSNNPNLFNKFIARDNVEVVTGDIQVPTPATNDSVVPKEYVDDTTVPKGYLDTDGTLSANSDVKIPSQKAVKTYSDTKLSKSGGTMTGALILSTSSPSSSLEAVSKGYADGLAIAGSPNASTTVKGIVEEASAAEIIAGTGTGATGARLFVNPTHVAETGVQKIPITNSVGKLNVGILPFTFGDGSDGTVNLDGTNTFSFLSKSGNTYTMTRDFYATTLTIGSGVTLKTDGFMPWASVEATGTGTLDWGTPNNGTSGSGPTAGTGGAASGTGRFRNVAGLAGANGASNNGGAIVSPPTAGAVIGIGVAGATGGFATSGSTPTQNTKFGVGRHNTLYAFDIDGVNNTIATFKASGQSTGGAGGGSSSGGSSGGGGGGSGATGGIVMLIAKLFSGTFTIKSNGGNGGNGGNAPGGADRGGSGGAGGSGGTGVIIYETKTWSGSYNLTGGTGGTGGTGTIPGTSGANGNTGNSYEIAMSSLI